MAYNPTDWKDRVVEKPRTYNIQENPDGTVTLIPAPGEIFEAGTGVLASHMNNIEQGITDAPEIAKAWAKSFGLGSYVEQDISGTNINNLTESGVYHGNNLTNSPNTSFYYYVLHIQGTSTGTGAYQRLVRNTSSGLFMHERVKANSAWQPFADVWHSRNLPDPARTNIENEFTQNQTFGGNFPIIMKGGVSDTPGKRNYRWDIVDDRLRLQALNESMTFVRGIFELDHDGDVFNHNGSTVWKGSNNPRSLGTSGYQKFASGILLQWGRTTQNIPTGVTTRVLFPITFSAAPMSIIASVDANQAASVSVGAGTDSGFNATHNHAEARPIMWFAIGIV